MFKERRCTQKGRKIAALGKLKNFQEDVSVAILSGKVLGFWDRSFPGIFLNFSRWLFSGIPTKSWQLFTRMCMMSIYFSVWRYIFRVYVFILALHHPPLYRIMITITHNNSRQFCQRVSTVISKTTVLAGKTLTCPTLWIQKAL